MSSRHRSNRIYGQFSPRHVEMLESPAYRVLSLSAHRVLSRIEIEYAHHGGNPKENGRLLVTYDQFVEYGIHRHSICTAIREVVALGFIEVTQKGRAGNAGYRVSNLFRLTYRASKGAPGDGTHEWKKIDDIYSAERIAKAARKTFPSDGKRTSPSDGFRHCKRKSPVMESVTTAIVRNPSLLSISRGGGSIPDTISTTPPPGGRPPPKAQANDLPSFDLHVGGAGPRHPDERPVFTENDFLSEDETVFIGREELENLARAHPSIMNVPALAADACKTWLADLPPRERKQAFLEWLAKREDHGGFEPCKRRRNGHRRAAS
jgi:hypothetical protein